MNIQNPRKSLRWRLTQVAAAGVIGACFVLAGCTRTPQEKEARYLEAGKRQIEKKDYSRAIIQFRNASRAMPKDAEPYYQLALAYMARKEWQATVANLKRALSLNANHQQAKLKLAELMATSGNKEILEGAQKSIQQVLTASPDNVDALDALAVTEWKLDKWQDAEKHLEQAFKKQPGHLKSTLWLAQVKMWRKDYSGAEEILKKTAEQKPPVAAPVLALAEFYFVTGKNAEGEKQLHRSLEIDPKFGPALEILGLYQTRIQKLDLAEQTYRRLAALPEKRYRGHHAIFLSATGKHDQAMAEFEALYRQTPDDRTLRSSLIREYLMAGKTGQAEKVVADILKKNSKDVDALVQQSTIFVMTGRTDEAQKNLTQALHFRNDSVEAHYLMAKVHQLRGNALNQRQELGEVLKLRKEFLPARLQLSQALIIAGSPQAALDLFKEVEGQANLLPVAVQRNWALIALNQTGEARKEVDRALAAVRAPDLLLQDAFLKSAAKDYAGARASLVEGLKRTPEDVRMLRLLTATYTAQKDAPGAVRVIQEHAAKNPKSPVVQQFLAELLMVNGQKAQARAALASVKAANPKLGPADLLLAQLDASEGRLGDASKTLNALIAQAPRNTTARLLLASVAETGGQRAAAIEEYRKVLDIQPNNVLALNNLAYGLAEDGKPADADEALKYAQKAAELAPNAAAVENTLGWVLFRKGLYSLAVPHLERAVATEATARRRCHLAMAYLKIGDEDRGQKSLDAALKMDPNLPEAKTALKMLDAMQGGR